MVSGEESLQASAVIVYLDGCGLGKDSALQDIFPYLRPVGQAFLPLRFKFQMTKIQIGQGGVPVPRTVLNFSMSPGASVELPNRAIFRRNAQFAEALFHRMPVR